MATHHEELEEFALIALKKHKLVRHFAFTSKSEAVEQFLAGRGPTTDAADELEYADATKEHGIVMQDDDDDDDESDSSVREVIISFVEGKGDEITFRPRATSPPGDQNGGQFDTVLRSNERDEHASASHIHVNESGIDAANQGINNSSSPPRTRLASIKEDVEDPSSEPTHRTIFGVVSGPGSIAETGNHELTSDNLSLTSAIALPPTIRHLVANDVFTTASSGSASSATLKSVSSDETALLEVVVLPLPYKPSTKDLKQLTRAYIKDLKTSRRANDNYVVLRVCGDQAGYVEGQKCILVEDEEGTVIKWTLGVAFVGADLKHGNPHFRLIKQQIVVLKEPVVALIPSSNELKYDIALRCDHLQDVHLICSSNKELSTVWTGPANKPVRSPKFWYEKGSKLMSSKLADALYCFTEGLSQPTDDTLYRRHDLPSKSSYAHLLRANSYLVLEQPDLARADLLEVGSHPDLDIQRLSAIARSSYELCMYREACDALVAAAKLEPEDSLIKEKLATCVTRYAEVSKGKYKWKQMYDELQESPTLDHASFFGSYEVQQSRVENAGRGLFATKDIAVGELIICEKAFVHVWSDGSDQKATAASEIAVLLDMDFELQTAEVGTFAALVGQACRKLDLMPSTRKYFHQLYAGEDYARHNFEDEILERIAQIELNDKGKGKETSAGSSLTVLKASNDYTHDELLLFDGSRTIDTFMVAKALTLNAFCPPISSKAAHFASRKSETSESFKYQDLKGLWLQLSNINHSCNSNSRHSFIGDIAIVRATKAIKKGEEITFWYAHPGERDFSHWGFECSCIICKDLNNTKEKTMRKRLKLTIAFEEVMNKSHLLTDTDELEKLLCSVEQTYTPGVPSYQCGLLRVELAKLYIKTYRPDMVVECCFKGLKGLGFVITGGLGHKPIPIVVVKWGLMTAEVVELWWMVRVAYVTMGIGGIVEAGAEKCARLAYLCCVGEDETFDEHYGIEGVKGDKGGLDKDEGEPREGGTLEEMLERES